MRVHRVDRTLETAGQYIAQHGFANAVLPRRSADHRDRTRIEQLTEISDTHVKSLPTGFSLIPLAAHVKRVGVSEIGEQPI